MATQPQRASLFPVKLAPALISPSSPTPRTTRQSPSLLLGRFYERTHASKPCSALRQGIAARIAEQKAKFPRFQPHLAILQQGARSDSSTYIKMKLKAAAEAGIKTTLVQLGTAQDGVGEQDVMAEVERLNADADVHGIIVQLPLSDEIGRDGERRITEAVSPEKDVDGYVSILLFAPRGPECPTTGRGKTWS